MGRRFRNGVPTLIGEFGLAYDIGKKAAYEKFRNDPEGAWETHVEALSMYYNAMDANLLHCTQWNYTADNSNERGDLWNLEDLSIFSKDQQTDPNDINSGSRAIKGFCRPRVLRCAGIPLKMEFDMKEGLFLLEFDGDASIKAPTIIYIPKIHFPSGFNIDLSEGEIERKDEEQIVHIKIKENGLHTLRIRK